MIPYNDIIMNMMLEYRADSLHQGIIQWIQCKLGRLYLSKKVYFASLGFE